MQGFFMKDYIEERAIEIATYIIEEKTTVRQAAKKFGVSKSTICIFHLSSALFPGIQST